MGKKNNKNKTPPLESGLLQCMTAIDNQVLREMQRSPAEREEFGVQKWEPYRTRVERITTLVLNAIGDNEIELDSLLVLTQSMSKSLSLVVDELGEEGLGTLRSAYCREVADNVDYDCERIKQVLSGSGVATLN